MAAFGVRAEPFKAAEISPAILWGKQSEWRIR
jgi:hypothetical protein